MSNQPAVVVSHLYKSFRLPHEQHNGFKQYLLNMHKKRGNNLSGYEAHHVLRDITFEIHKGDFFGIVGRNGSGKSTLLKLLAGIYLADKGSVSVHGSISPFIELGVGFNPELTGRENVYLNGALLGFSHTEMDAMYDDIVQFAELEKFMDQKLKNYSSGMQVRLAFSIAIRARGDILLIDEVLAVGDSAFQKKCFDYFEDAKHQKKTIILVTHDMSAVERFCNRAVLIDKGVVKKIGDPFTIASEYTYINQPRETKEDDSSEHLGKLAQITESSASYFPNTRIINTITVTIKFTSKIDKNVLVAISIIREDNIYIAGQNSSSEKYIVQKGKNTTTCHIDVSKLMKGRYFINVSLYSKKYELYDFTPNISRFYIRDNRSSNKDGIVDLPGDWVNEKSK